MGNRISILCVLFPLLFFSEKLGEAQAYGDVAGKGTLLALLLLFLCIIIAQVVTFIPRIVEKRMFVRTKDKWIDGEIVVGCVKEEMLNRPRLLVYRYPTEKRTYARELQSGDLVIQIDD